MPDDGDRVVLPQSEQPPTLPSHLDTTMAIAASA
jgi:hypothetical protein